MAREYAARLVVMIKPEVLRAARGPLSDAAADAAARYREAYRSARAGARPPRYVVLNVDSGVSLGQRIYLPSAVKLAEGSAARGGACTVLDCKRGLRRWPDDPGAAA